MGRTTSPELKEMKVGDFISTTIIPRKHSVTITKLKKIKLVV